MTEIGSFLDFIGLWTILGLIEKKKKREIKVTN